MSVPSIPKDQFLAIKQLWQTKLALEEKVKSLEAICNINGNLKSILENLTKEFRAIPGSSISDTTGGSTVVDPATINHELLGGLLGGAANDHFHLTTLEKFKSQEPYDVWKTILSNMTGFKTNNLVVINGDTTTYKVTLTGTVEAYYKGTQVTELVDGWVSGAHGTDTSKVYMLRYAGSTFDWIDLTTTPLDFTWLLIAYTFYDSVAGKWVYLREPHGFMDAECHKSDHLSIGTYKLSGGTPSGTVLDSTTAADRRPLVSETVIRDEDIDTTVPALASEVYTQAKLTSTGIVSFAVDANDIIRLSTNRPYYNTFSTPNWGDTLFPSQSVGSVWCFVLPAAADANSQKYRLIHFMPQWVTTSGVPTVAGMNTATTQELTRNVSELNLGNFINIIPESVAIIRYVIAYDATGYANNWVLKNVSILSGSRVSQISTPAGNFLSTVSVDETLNGNGTILSPLSVALTPVDTASINLSITGKSIDAVVLPAGVDHNSLANLTTGDPHTQYTENSGSITQITTRNHNDLQNLNGGADYQHMTAAQIAALHPAVTIADTTSVDLSLTGQQISAAVLPAGVDHNSLANLTTGDPHTQYTENSGSITQITTRNHSDLQNKNDETDVKHLTDAQVSALHAAVTIADSTSVDLSLTGQQISAAVLPAGVDHNSLANLTTGDPHTQYTENSGNITQITTRNHNDLQNHNAGADLQHMTAAQIAALHARSHAITSSSDHTSSATAGTILKADTNGLPVNSIITESGNVMTVAGSGAIGELVGAVVNSEASLRPVVNKLLGDTTDSVVNYILLCKTLTSSPFATTGFDGVIDLYRGKSTFYNNSVKININIKNANTDYLIGIFNVFRAKSGTPSDLDLVTVDYGGSNYAALRIYTMSAHTVFYSGRSWGSEPSIVSGAGVTNVTLIRKANQSTNYLGNSGFGITSPLEKAHAYDLTSSKILAEVGSGGIAALKLMENTSGVLYGFEFLYDGSVDKMYLWTRSFAAAEAVRMVFLKTGFVCIGASDPTEKFEVEGNAKISGSGNIKAILKTTTCALITGVDASVEFETTDATYATLHRIFLRARNNSLVIEHKTINAVTNTGQVIVTGSNGPGSIWIANSAASPALGNSMGALTFGTTENSSHVLTALHGDYGTGKVGGGKLSLYQKDSSLTFRENVTFDGLNRRVGINDTAPGETLDVNGNINITGALKIDDVQVIKEQQAAIADAKTNYAAGELDTEAKIISAINASNTTMNAILARLRTHGLIAT